MGSRSSPPRVGAAGRSEVTQQGPRHENRAWLERHISHERRESDLLGEIREAMFGMQDGIVSTLAVVITVGAATTDRFTVLVAGLAAALAGVFSMAAGEYMSSKSQREIFEAQIDNEREEIRDRPGESEAEVAYLLEEEGLTADAARRVTAELARHPNVLLRTMVEKELGLTFDEGKSALFGAAVMGGSFGVAAIVPILPYLILPIQMAGWGALTVSAIALFIIGAVKARWTRRNPIRSGLEIVTLAAIAGLAGSLIGGILPRLLGVSVPVV